MEDTEGNIREENGRNKMRSERENKKLVGDGRCTDMDSMA